MEEKRKHKRLPLKLELTISSLFKQDFELIDDVNESIQVKNISKTGIGFTCSHELPLGFYFDAKIQLTEDKFFYAVLKIIRVEEINNGYSVGCEFIGLADILSDRVDLYRYDLESNQ
jgi:hypothetical protein